VCVDEADGVKTRELLRIERRKSALAQEEEDGSRLMIMTLINRQDNRRRRLSTESESDGEKKCGILKDPR
jgi:hypothetical protein